MGGKETGLDEEHSKGELRKEYKHSVMRQKRKIKILGWGKTVSFEPLMREVDGF